MSRDFATEMTAYVDAELAHATGDARTIAATVVDQLRADDPQLLEGWLDTYDALFVEQLVAARMQPARPMAVVTHLSDGSVVMDAGTVDRYLTPRAAAAEANARGYDYPTAASGGSARHFLPEAGGQAAGPAKSRNAGPAAHHAREVAR